KHPLVAVVDFESISELQSYTSKWGLYAIMLKDTKCCDINYGKTRYDYDDMSIVSFAPGQVTHIDIPEGVASPSGKGVLFHPDFLFRTPLAQGIKKYSYFSYDSSEALHLSAEERQTIVDTIERIRAEIDHHADKFSKRLIISNIELLLDYCMRYYSRQFIVREEMNYGIIAKFENLLDSYLSDGKGAEDGIPSVKYFADKVALSPNYFGDLVKRETGVTAQDYIHEKVLNQAKMRLLSGDKNVSQVAYSLGFQYPQHFIRFFKRKAGVTPKEFINMN
ncbi:AraC family transcriptional regulator, partial [uncultured Duncaniella sp.]